MVRVVVELHLLIIILIVEIIVCSSCACHRTGLCRLWRAIVATEALTIHVVVIILTIIRLVKRFVVVFNGLQLLCILILVVNSKTISLITCIRNSSWVCAIACEVAKLADNTLRANVDVLGVLTTLPSNEVWADIETEPCRTRITPRELGILRI